MDRGVLSASLSAKDIAPSSSFYEALGFPVFGGDRARRWPIMRYGTAAAGLFQALIDKPLLSFNPGRAADGTTLPAATDVGEIRRRLRPAGVIIEESNDDASQGHGHLVVNDPDGIRVPIDPHEQRRRSRHRPGRRSDA